MMPEKLAFFAYALLLWALPLVAVYVPRCGAFLLPVAAGLALPAAWQQRAYFKKYLSLRYALVGVLVLSLLALGWVFSSEAARANEAVQSVLLYGGSVLLVLAGTKALGASARQLLWRGLYFALLLAAVLIVFDFTHNMAVNTLISRVAGEAPPIPFQLDRSIITVVLLFWGVLAGCAAAGVARLGVAVGFVFLFLVSQSMSQAATIGLVSGLGVYLLSYCASLRWVRGGLVALILSLLLFMPQLVQIAAGLIGDDPNFWPAASGTARLQIWLQTVDYIKASPWFGYGIEAARGLPLLQGNIHPHNGPLQLWLEFGVLGPLLVAALLILLVRSMRDWPEAVARAGYAALVCWLMIFCVSYNIWQAWWMASAVTLAILMHFMVGFRPQLRPAWTP